MVRINNRPQRHPHGQPGAASRGADAAAACRGPASGSRAIRAPRVVTARQGTANQRTAAARAAVRARRKRPQGICARVFTVWQGAPAARGCGGPHAGTPPGYAALPCPVRHVRALCRASPFVVLWGLPCLFLPLSLPSSLPLFVRPGRCRPVCRSLRSPGRGRSRLRSPRWWVALRSPLAVRAAWSPLAVRLAPTRSCVRPFLRRSSFGRRLSGGAVGRSPRGRGRSCGPRGCPARAAASSCSRPCRVRPGCGRRRRRRPVGAASAPAPGRRPPLRSASGCRSSCLAAGRSGRRCRCRPGAGRGCLPGPASGARRGGSCRLRFRRRCRGRAVGRGRASARSRLFLSRQEPCRAVNQAAVALHRSGEPSRASAPALPG